MNVTRPSLVGALLLCCIAAYPQQLAWTAKAPLPEGARAFSIITQGEGYAITAFRKPPGQSYGQEWYLRSMAGTFGPYKEIVSCALSPAKGAMVGVVKKEAGTYVVVGSSELGPFESVKIHGYSRQDQMVFTARQGDAAYAYQGTSRMGPYDDIGEVVALPDGSECVLTARKSGAWYLVSSTRQWGPYEELLDWKALNSERGDVEHLYCAKELGQWWVYRGGTRLGPFDGVGTEPRPAGTPRIVLSPDRKHLAFFGRIGGSWYLVTDTSRLGPYEDVGYLDGDYSYDSLAWSPDGRTLSYTAKVEGSWYVFSGERRFGPFREVTNLASSQQGSLSYRYRTPDGYFLQANGFARGPYARILDVLMSDVGDMLAYATAEMDTMGRVTGVFVYRDAHGGRTGGRDGPWSSFSSLLGSTRGSVAYIGVSSDTTFPDGRWQVVVDGRTDPTQGYDYIQNVSISDDGLSFSYLTRRGSKLYSVSNRGRSEPFDWIGAYSLPGPGMVGNWLALIGREWYAFAGGKKSGPVSLLNPKGVFTPMTISGRACLYRGAYDDREKATFLIVDGRTHVGGLSYDGTRYVTFDGSTLRCYSF